MSEFEKVYIGDGVLARWDGQSVLLETQRDTGTHYIYLEPAHIERLVKLVTSEPRIEEQLPKCPKCGAEDAMEHRQHRFSTERGPSLPDCDWEQCAVCGYATDPE